MRRVATNNVPGQQLTLDFIVATDGILPYVRAAGFRSLHKSVVSDRIPLWADVDMNAFFGGENLSITPPKRREFSINNVEMRKKFFRERKCIHAHQILHERNQALETSL